MHIGLVFDLQSDPTQAWQAEFDPPATIAALETALSSLGHRVSLLGNADALLADPALARQVDLVFNIAEGSRGRCREAQAPLLLEHWGIPFVGSDALTQALALDKVMAKRLAASSGVETPAWRVIESLSNIGVANALGFPLIVKPRYEGSGMGIDPGAVVRDTESLRHRVEWVLERFRQPALVERFISFGELTVFLIGNAPVRSLPVIQRPLDPASRLSCHVAGKAAAAAWLSPLDLTQDLEKKASQAAMRVFETLACRDMARADFRGDESGNVYFLEINPLPSFDPQGSIGLLAECMGATYAGLIGQILEAAVCRLDLKGKAAAA